MAIISFKRGRLGGFNISLAQKITIGFLIIGILLLVTLVNNYRDASRTRGSLSLIVEETIPLFASVSDIAQRTQQLENPLKEVIYLETQDAINLKADEVASGIQAIQASIDEAAVISGIQNQKDPELQSIEEILKNITEVSSQLFDRQIEVVTTNESIAEKITSIYQQQSDLEPLLEELTYSVDDDYVISLVQELSSLIKSGLIYIGQMQTALTADELNNLNSQMDDWLTSYKSLIRVMPITAGEDPELYRSIMASVDSATTNLLLLASGRYDPEHNTYIDGLAPLRLNQIELKAQQSTLLDTLSGYLDAILETSQHKVNVEFKNIDDSIFSVNETLVSQQNGSWLTGGIAVLVVLSISIYITYFFRSQISNLQQSLDRLAGGDLTKFPDTNRRDEFGRINKAIAKVIDSLHTIVLGIHDANSKIHDGVALVNDQSSETHRNIESQKSELDMVVTALTQMASTANEVASHASDTHKKVNNASDIAKEGRQSVETSKENINLVDEQSKVAADVINSLNEGVKGIEAILQTIGSIAEQTNLLALNAAIEAARAGEQGRGFAVVADEVRALASRTQTSTQEIREMIEKMLTQSGRAVDVIQENRNLISVSVESANVAGDVIAKFDAIMVEVLDLSMLIATASEEQAATVLELNRNVTEVSDLAEQTRTTAESTQTTSGNLGELADSMQEKAAAFTV